MIIENIQQLLEHIETDKKAEELVDYINILQIENKQLNSILTDLEETIKNKIKSFKENKDYFIDEKDMYELDNLIQGLKEKYK